MKYFLFAFILLAFSSCRFNQSKPSEGIAFLQGKWAEDSVLNKSQLISYQQYYITFTCDSFYLNIHSYSKTNLNGGACYDSKSWQEFAKGYYKLVNDTLKLEGNFVDKAYKYKKEGSCYRFGKYKEDFILDKKSEENFIIKSLQTSLYHQLVLKEKLVCMPSIHTK